MFCSLSLIVLFSLLVSPSLFSKKLPNFVFFLVDDLGWGDLGCYGSEFHETPHLDKLADEGMKFTNAYSACTVCSPSRADSTRWAAYGESVPQWWMLVFSKTHPLNGIEIRWKNPTWYSHKVQVSNDGKKWKTVSNASGKKTVPAQSEHSFSAKTKFLRVTVDALGDGWTSLTELKPLFKTQ